MYPIGNHGVIWNSFRQLPYARNRRFLGEELEPSQPARRAGTGAGGGRDGASIVGGNLVDSGAIAMIVEIAVLTIRPGSEAQFEAAFQRAIAVPAASKGFLAHELRRSVETPNRYALRIEWETLEDHIVGFRGSPAFVEWRERVGPFFESPPVVEHFRPVAGEP
jgi:heme-degrading monooxygenase HmoA